MTDPIAHPDAEALSALIDGEGTSADRDHVAACVPCRDRLAGLRSVRAALGAPVPVDDAAVAAAVETAITHAAGTPSGHTPWRQRRRYSPPAAWAGIAALVLALLAAVPLLLRDGDAEVTTGQRSALQQDDAGTAEDSAAALTGRASGAARADFGAHDDTATLVALLSTGEYAAPPRAEDETDTGAAEAAPTAGDQAVADGTEGSCVTEGRRVAAGRARELVATGPVRWRGEEAVVVVFALDAEEPGGDRQLYVMSRSGCDVLAEQRF